MINQVEQNEANTVARTERTKESSDRADASKDVRVAAEKKGVRVPRFFTREGVDPMGEEAGIIWEKRQALISGADGEVLFEQNDVEMPRAWSQRAQTSLVWTSQGMTCGS